MSPRRWKRLRENCGSPDAQPTCWAWEMAARQAAVQAGRRADVRVSLGAGTFQKALLDGAWGPIAG